MDEEYITLYFLMDKDTNTPLDVARTTRELAMNNGVAPSTVRACINKYETGQIGSSKYAVMPVPKDVILDFYRLSVFIDEMNN